MNRQSGFAAAGKMFGTAAVLACLTFSPGQARGAWVSIVNLDTYQGGTPTALDLDGVDVELGQTARLGIVIELMDGTLSDTGAHRENSLHTFFPFLNGLGDVQTVRLVDTQSHPVNDAGETWHSEHYSTGMVAWITDLRDGPPVTTPAPFLENYHVISFDDVPACPHEPGHQVCGGNRFNGNRVILFAEIEVEPIVCCGQEMKVVFDTGLSEMYDLQNRQYQWNFDQNVGHVGSLSGGQLPNLIPRNAYSGPTSFRIRMNPGFAGACCLGPGECTYDDEAGCAAAGGRFIGIGTNCASQIASQTIIEPGGEVFVHAIGVELQCPDPGRAIECVDRPYKIDPWTSEPHALMCQRFDVAGSPPIPAGFFGNGSNPFMDVICLEGVPLGETEYGEFGEADTLIHRSSDPFSRCELPSGETRSVPLRIAALNLQAPNPVNVTYAAGPSEQWNVTVDLSEVYTDGDPNNDPPPGTLWATKTHCNGGTYTSLLPVQARFHFTKVGAPGVTRVLDTGLAGIAPVELDGRANPLPWVTDVGDSIALMNPVCTDFHAGIHETATTMACDCDGNGVHDGCQEDCNGNGRADPCDIGTNPNLDCNLNLRIDACDVSSGASSDVDHNQIPDECQCTANSECVTGAFCTGNRACVANVCRTTAMVCAPNTYCDEATDSCVQCLVDSHCADSTFCDGAEVCVGGSCQNGTAPCGPGEVCLEAQDRCVECLTAQHCSDGLYCTGAETCVNGTCAAGSDPCAGAGMLCDEANNRCVCDDDDDCDDGLFCTGAEGCDAGECASAGDPCAGLGLYCDEALNDCVECLNAEHCQDGQFCNGAESCVDGSCAASSDPCAALGLACDEGANTCRCDDDGDCANGNFCDGIEACVGGLCQSPGNPCPGAQPFCVEASDSCVACLTSANCGDGAFCTGAEVCTQGQCASTGDPCSAMGLGCNESTDSCVCNDAGDCDDGQFCNGPEQCNGGVCNSPGNPCLAQGMACDESLNRCFNCVTTADCNDASLCNGFESCVAGRCTAGQPPCPDGHCSESAGGCVKCTSDAHCDDGVYCNGAERCNAGDCLVGNPPCGEELCDEEAGRCLACTTNAHCSDGLYCNGAERCVDSVCVGGERPCIDQPCSEFADRCASCTSAIHCDDGDPCTIDTCEELECRSIRQAGCDEDIPPAADGDDDDGDGVPDGVDGCPGTVAGAEVDLSGCSCAQRDADDDGVNDCDDACPDSEPDVTTNAAGCTPRQQDGDGDGVVNSVDRCPGTPAGHEVDARGCTLGQEPTAGQDVEAADEADSGPPATTGCGLLGLVPLLGSVLTLRMWGRRRVSR